MCSRSGKLSLFAVAVLLMYVQSFAGTPFYFVQITDTHWGFGDNLERTRTLVEAINKLPQKIEFVVHTGDMSQANTGQALIDSGLAIMKQLKYPVLYVGGNHDITSGRCAEKAADFKRNYGGLYTRREVLGVSIITLFNVIVQDTDGKPAFNSLFELDSLLKGKPAKMPAIVFLHDPMVEDFYNNCYHANWPAGDLDRFTEMCENNEVTAVIAGHFHRAVQHLLGKIPLYVSTPVSGAFGRQMSFRIYKYDNGKVTFTTQY